MQSVICSLQSANVRHRPMAAITEKSFSENISLHKAENIETIISTSPKQRLRNIIRTVS